MGIIAAVSVLALVITGAATAAIISSLPNDSRVGGQTSSATASTLSEVYQVIRSNLSLRGQVASIPCKDLGMICPPASDASLSHVELIEYGGMYFYSHNQTAPTGEPGVHPMYEVWFTNSTVFCVSPVYPQNPTCPTLPYRQTTITIPMSSASTLDSSLGLVLTLTLSTNSMGNLTVGVAEQNILDRVNNVTLAKNWPVQGESLFLWTQAACADSPYGYEILQGNYAENNFTDGAALFLLAQGPGQCVTRIGPNYLIFEPRSDISSNINQSISLSETSSGFWTGKQDPYYGSSCPDSGLIPNSSEDCPLAFTPFAPGIYTVVAGDEWGQVAILHFSVQG